METGGSQERVVVNSRLLPGCRASLKLGPAIPFSYHVRVAVQVDVLAELVLVTLVGFGVRHVFFSL